MAWSERRLPFCDMQKFLWLPENARSPGISYLQALFKKHAIVSVKVKLSKHKTWTYLKANRSHKTLHTLQKQLQSVHGGK